MNAVYNAVDALTETLRGQCRAEGWRFKSEYDDGTWYKLEMPKSEDADYNVLVEISRTGVLEFTGDSTQVSARITNMFKALSFLMIEFWEEYRKEGKA